MGTPCCKVSTARKDRPCRKVSPARKDRKMVKFSNKGAFVFGGRLIVEDADRLSREEIGKRLAGAGLAPPSEAITKA